MVTRRLTTAVLLMIAGSLSFGQANRPNIVYVLVDNWGWGDISIQGGVVPTPRIDSLASEGLRLTNFNVEVQCTPTRSAIMTGRLPIRSGTHRVTIGAPYGLAPWEYTLAELLSDSGYQTALYGKWHLGEINGRLPTDQGFDEWYGIKNSTEAEYSSTPQFDSDIFPEPFIWQGRKGKQAIKVKPLNLDARKIIDREIVERSEKFIARQEKNKSPFFLFVGLTQIHPPMMVHPEFKNSSRAGTYADIITELDYNIGRILDALDKAGLRNDTMVILTGDNGTDPEAFGGGSNGPWRGGFTGYEGGLRTPGMLRWPGMVKAGRVSNEIFASLDWMPTIANIIGETGRIPEDRPIDGIDQTSFLLGGEQSEREHVVFYIGNELFSVKWRSLKVHFKTIEKLVEAPVQSYVFPPMYDVVNDPGEVNDIFVETAWAYGPVQQIIGDLTRSYQRYPNIAPGADFTGYE